MRIPSKHDDPNSLEDQLAHEIYVVGVIHKLLDMTLKNLEKRDLGEMLPHEFFVAMGVAEHGQVSDEARRLLGEPKSMPLGDARCSDQEPNYCGGVLAEEIDTYFRVKKDLLENHEGKHVLIKSREVLGIFDSFENAYRAGVDKLGNTPMLIRQILQVEPVHRM